MRLRFGFLLLQIHRNPEGRRAVFVNAHYLADSRTRFIGAFDRFHVAVFISQGDIATVAAALRDGTAVYQQVVALADFPRHHNAVVLRFEILDDRSRSHHLVIIAFFAGQVRAFRTEVGGYKPGSSRFLVPRTSIWAYILVRDGIPLAFRGIRGRRNRNRLGIILPLHRIRNEEPALHCIIGVRTHHTVGKAQVCKRPAVDLFTRGAGNIGVVVAAYAHQRIRAARTGNPAFALFAAFGGFGQVFSRPHRDGIADNAAFSDDVQEIIVLRQLLVAHNGHNRFRFIFFSFLAGRIFDFLVFNSNTFDKQRHEIRAFFNVGEVAVVLRPFSNITYHQHLRLMFRRSVIIGFQLVRRHANYIVQHSPAAAFGAGEIGIIYAVGCKGIAVGHFSKRPFVGAKRFVEPSVKRRAQAFAQAVQTLADGPQGNFVGITAVPGILHIFLNAKTIKFSAILFVKCSSWMSFFPIFFFQATTSWRVTGAGLSA